MEEEVILVLELREVGEVVDLRDQGGEGLSEIRQGKSKNMQR